MTLAKAMVDQGPGPRPALPPKPAFLCKTFKQYECTRSVPTTKVVTMYDFKGMAEFHELSFVTGEFLHVERTHVESDYPAWGVARRGLAEGSERGLVPLEYLEIIKDIQDSNFVADLRQAGPVESTDSAPMADFLVRDDYMQHESRASSDVACEIVTIAKPRNHSSLGGRALNRFSIFVRSGVEDYLTKPSTLLEPIRSRDRSSAGESEANEPAKYYIEHGPAWHEMIKPYQIQLDSARIVVMKTRSSYAIYKIRTLYKHDHSEVQICVDRRFRDFERLHNQLSTVFPIIILPWLPPKTLFSCLETNFLQRRRLLLECYLRRLVRHPIIRSSDIVTGFLADDDRVNEHQTRAEINFFDSVVHPEWNHDNGERDRVEEFSRRLEISLGDMQALTTSLEAIDLTAQRHAAAMTDLASAFADFSLNQASLVHDDDIVTDSLLETAKHYGHLSDHTKTSHVHILETLYQRLAEWRNILEKWSNLDQIHRYTIQKLERVRGHSEEKFVEAESRCDTILNVILAEMEVVRVQFAQDLMQSRLEIEAGQQTMHARCTAEMEQKLTMPLSLSSKRQIVTDLDAEDCRSQRTSTAEMSSLSRLMHAVYPR